MIYLAPNTPVNPSVPLAPGVYGPPALASHTLDGDGTGAGGSGGGAGSGSGGGAEAEVIQRRRLTNNIFRASAKIYLHTVLSGDFPACPEIKAAVGETVEALRDVPEERPVTPLGFVPRGFGNTASGSGGLASPLPSMQMPATPTSAVG